MRGMQIALTFFGRVAISMIFILSACHKILDWEGTQKALMNALCDWSSYLQHVESMQKFCVEVVPFMTVILVVTTLLELFGGLLVLLGLKARLGAFLLILFLIPTTVFFHQFWFLEGPQKELQTVMFLKNLAILGGLLYILAYGAKVERKERYPFVDKPSV